MEISSKAPPWPNNPSAYTVTRVLGIGAFGLVSLAVCNCRQEPCAVKRYLEKKVFSSGSGMWREIQLMVPLHHANLVSLHNCFMSDHRELWVVNQYMEGGNLKNYLRHAKRKPAKDPSSGLVEEPVIASILHEVLLGVEYLATKNCPHRNLKSANILFGADGSVKLGDYGVAAWIATGCNTDITQMKFQETPCWTSPELLRSGKVSPKCDIWSIGIIGLEMVTGSPPYSFLSPINAFSQIVREDPPSLEMLESENLTTYTNYGEDSRNFFRNCLQKRPSQRPSAGELLECPWIRCAGQCSHLVQAFIKDCQITPARSTRKKIFRFIQPGLILETHPRLGEQGKLSSTRLQLKLTIRSSQETLQEIRFNLDLAADDLEIKVEELLARYDIDNREKGPIMVSLKRMLEYNRNAIRFFPLNSQKYRTMNPYSYFGYATLEVEK